MCLQDLRLGRHIRSVIQVANLTAAQSVTIGANQQRVGIMIAMIDQAPTSNSVGIVSIDGIQVASINSASGPLLFLMTTHGDLPTRGFVINGAGLGVDISMTEFIASEEVLSALYDEFKRG